MIDLRLGDCLEILPTLGHVDAVVTDPPYGIRLRNNSFASTRKEYRRREPYRIAGDEGPETSLSLLEWAARNEIPTIAFSSPWNPWPGRWRNLIVWDKGGAVGGGGDIKRCLKRSWELIQIARNGPMCGRREESVWRYPITPRDTAEHIAAKPVALMEALIKRFAPKGCVVLDPFMGSGATGVACVNTGRSFIGIEKDEAYFRIAEQRIKEAAGSTPLFSEAI